MHHFGFSVSSHEENELFKLTIFDWSVHAFEEAIKLLNSDPIRDISVLQNYTDIANAVMLHLVVDGAHNKVVRFEPILENTEEFQELFKVNLSTLIFEDSSHVFDVHVSDSNSMRRTERFVLTIAVILNDRGEDSTVDTVVIL